MSRRPQQLLMPPRPGTSNMEWPPAFASASPTDMKQGNQGSPQPHSNCGNGVHSDALTYRAVAARAVGGCNNSSLAVPSAQVVVASQPGAGKSGTDPRPPASSARTTVDSAPIRAAQPCLPSECSRADDPLAAPAASGNALCGAACGNISNSAASAATTAGASAPRQGPLRKKTSQRDSSVLIQQKKPSGDGRAANWKVPHKHSAAVADSEAAELRRPGSPAASCCSPARVVATQEGGRSKGQQSATEDTTAVDTLTKRTGGNNTATRTVTTALLRGRRREGSLCGKKKRQQHRRQQSSAHLPQKQQLCTEQQPQQHDSRQQHHRHHAEQLFAQQQPQSRELSMQREQRQQLLEHRQQNQQELKQHPPRPLYIIQGQNDQLECSTAKQVTVVASSDGAFSDVPGTTDDISSCSSPKEGFFPGKNRNQLKEHRKGGEAGYSNGSTSGKVGGVPHAAYSSDSSSCGPMGSGYTSQGEDEAHCHQRQGRRLRSSSTNRGNTDSSSSSTGSSSINSGSSIGYNSSVSNKCSTSSTSACGSSDDSGSGGISSSKSVTKTHSGNASSTHAGTGEASTLHGSSRCAGNSATAVAVLCSQQTSYTKETHLSTIENSGGSSEEKSQRECTSRKTSQQGNSATDILQRSKKNSYCARKRHDNWMRRASPSFEKKVKDNHKETAAQRRASASGRVRQCSNNKSSTRCSSTYRCSKIAGITADSPAGVGVATLAAENSVGSAAVNAALRAADGVPQRVAETGVASADRIGDAPAPSATVGESAACDTVAEFTSQREGGCMQSRNTTHSRRGRSTPCVRPMPRGKAHNSGTAAAGVSPAPTALHNLVACKATIPSDAGSAARDTADSKGASVRSVGTCSVSSATAASAAVAPAASVGDSLAVTTSAADAYLFVREDSVNPVTGPSVESEISNKLGANAAAGMKGNPSSKKNRPTSRLAKADNFQHTEIHQRGAVTASAATPAGAGTQSNGRKQQTGRFTQINWKHPPPALSPGLRAAGTSKCKPAGAVSTATRVASSIAARGTAASSQVPAVFHTANSNPKPTTKATRTAEARTPKGAITTDSAATPATSSANARTTEPGAPRRSTKSGATETDSIMNEAVFVVSVQKENPETLRASDSCGTVKSLQHPASATRSPQACVEAASARTAADDGASASTFTKTSAGADAKATATEEGNSSARLCTDHAGGATGSLEIPKEQDVQEAQLFKLATAGVERISVLLPDGSLNLKVFKVFPCRNRNPQHEKKSCPYYHNSRDRRRTPVTYRAEQCEEHFDLDTVAVQCSKGEACEKSHNRHELLYHPHIYKQRFCSNLPCILPFKGHEDERGSHPNTRKGTPCCTSSTKGWGCVRGVYCAFAHSREEIRATLFTEEEEKNPDSRFFVNKFKTIWCPYGSQHDWRTCVYAHTYQDCRRSPLIGYGSEPCAAWNKDLHSADYEKRCPHGARCSFSHGSKEQLYHPSYYKTMPCIDYRPATVAGSNSRNRGTAQQQHLASRNATSSGTSASSEAASALAAAGGCPRGFLCAFYHEGRERRLPTPPCPQFTYATPLPASQLKLLQPLFLKPPLFNLDDFEAFGHTSRQTAALRRSQAITNGQSAGDGVASKTGSQSTTAGEAGGATVSSCELALSSRSSTKVQHRNNYSHKTGAAAPASRFREVGALTSPQQTKWLSNSNPLDHRPAEGLKTYCLPSPAGSAFSGVSGDVSAATARARSVGSGARAHNRKSSAAVTCDPAGPDSSVARGVASVVSEDAVVPSVKAKQPSGEKHATAAGGGVNSFTQSLKGADFCSSDRVRKEAATVTANTLSLSPHACQVEQVAPYVLNVHAALQNQLQYKLPSKRQQEGPQRGQEQHRKQHNMRHQAQQNPPSERLSQSRTLQPRRQEQHQDKPHESHMQMKKTLTHFKSALEFTEMREKCLKKDAAVETAMIEKKDIGNECTRIQSGHIFTEGQSAAASATSNAAIRGTVTHEGFRADETASRYEELAVCAGAAAGSARIGEAPGSATEAAADVVTGENEVAVSVNGTERTVDGRTMRQIGARLVGNSAPAHACGGSHEARLPQKGTPEKTSNVGQEVASVHLYTSAYHNERRRFEPLLQPQARKWEHSSEEQQLQTVVSAQERQPDREELQHLSWQPLGQHEQGLFQGHDLLVAAISNVDQHEALSPSLCSWHPHLVSIPRDTTELENAFRASDCIQKSTDAEALSSSGKTWSDDLALVTNYPARMRTTSTNKVLEQDLLLQTTSKTQLAGLHGSENTGDKEQTFSSRNSDSANSSCGSGRDRSCERVEGRRVARNGVSPSTPVRPAKGDPQHQTFMSPTPEQEHVLALEQHKPDDALHSLLPEGENCLRPTWSDTHDTCTQRSNERQPSHGHFHNLQVQGTSGRHNPAQHGTDGVGGLMARKIVDCLSSSNTRDGNCSTNSSNTNSSSSSSTSSSSSSSSYNADSSEGSSHVGSGMGDSSRKDRTTGRKFVGLFNNGRVWQVPSSGNIRDTRDSLWTTAASGSTTLNYSSREYGKCDAPRSFASYSFATSHSCGGSSTGMVQPAACRGYSHWVTPSGCTVKYGLPASSPPCSATGPTSCVAAAVVIGREVSRNNDVRHCHTSQLFTILPSQCHSSRQLPPGEAGADAQKVDAIGIQCVEAVFSIADSQAPPGTRSASAAAPADDNLQASITGTQLFAAEGATAAADVIPVHFHENLVGTCEKISPLCWKQSVNNTAPGSTSQLLSRSLQTPTRNFQEQISSIYQVQRSLSSRAYDGTPGVFETAHSDVAFDPRSEAEAMGTAGVEAVDESEVPKTTGPHLATSRTPMGNAAAVLPVGWRMRLVQSLGPPKAATVFASEGRTWRRSSTTSAALPCIGNISNWNENHYDNSSTIYAGSHSNRTNNEHCDRGGGTDSSSSSNCHSGNSSYESSTLGDDNNRDHCTNDGHNTYNCILPLPGGRQLLWGNALFDTGDCPAPEELQEATVHRECFASSAPPRLSSSNPLQQQEIQQREQHPEAPLRNQQRCREKKHVSSTHLLQPDIQPDQKGQHAVHLGFCHIEGNGRHQSPTGQPKLLQCTPTVCFHRRRSREIFLPPNTLNVGQHHQESCLNVLNFCRSSRGDTAAAAWFQPHYEICTKTQDEPGASRARSQSEEAAAAAAAVLNLLEDDERCEQLLHEEHISACSERNSDVCCPSSVSSKGVATALTGSALGPAVTESKTILAKGSYSPTGNDILLPAPALPATKAISKIELLYSQAPLSIVSAGESWLSVNDYLALANGATTRVLHSPSEVASAQQPYSTHDKSNNVPSVDGAGAGPTVADASVAVGAEAASEHKLKVSVMNDPSALHTTATAFVDDPTGSTGHDQGVHTVAGPRITVSGPLVIGSATLREQQQLLLLLLRSQLWEKILVILYPTTAGPPQDTHSEEQKDLQSAHRACGYAKISTGGEAQGGARTAVKGACAAVAADLGAAEPVAQTDECAEEVARNASAPTAVGLAETPGGNSGGPFRGKTVGSSTPGAPADASTYEEGTATEEASSIEKEAATIVRTAEKADYSCEAVSTDDHGLQPMGSGLLLALKSVGLDMGIEQQHRQGRRSTARGAVLIDNGIQHRTPHFLNQQLLMLTHIPHQRLQWQPSMNERQAEKRLQQNQQRLQPREAEQHLTTQGRSQVGEQERESSELPVAAPFSSERSLLAVLVLHRSPLELNKWLCRSQQQSQHEEDGSHSAADSISTRSNGSSGDCPINNSRSIGRKCHACTSMTTLGGGLEQASQTRTRPILTKVTRGTTANQPDAAALSVGRAAPPDMLPHAVEPSPPVAAAPTVDRTELPTGALGRERVHPCTRASASALTHVVVLHIVCNCQSSLALLSHLSPHLQERCFFPQAHELPLWSSFLHCGRGSYRQRRGRSSNRSNTNRSRTSGCCAARTSSSTSRNSAGSKTATSTPPMGAPSTVLPSSPPFFAVEVASVQSETPSAAITKLATQNSAVDAFWSGVEVLCRSTSGKSGFVGPTTSRTPLTRNKPDMLRTQCKSSNTVESHVPHKGTTAAEGPGTRRVVEETVASEITNALTTADASASPAQPSLSDVETKNLLVRCVDAALLAPTVVPEACNYSRTSGSNGKFRRAEKSDSGFSVNTQACRLLADDGAPADSKTPLSCSYVSESFPTCSRGYKCRSASCSYATDCSGSNALSRGSNSVSLIRSNSGYDSGSLKKQCASSSGKAACSVVSQKVRARTAGKRAGQSNVLLTLLLMEELREAKSAAASLLRTQRPNEVLVCVCCCYDEGAHPLVQQSFTFSLLPPTDPSAAIARDEEGKPAGRVGEVAATRDNGEELIQPGAIQGGLFLDPGGDIRSRRHKPLSPQPRLQAQAAFRRGSSLEQCATTCFLFSRKESDAQLRLSKRSSTEKSGDSVDVSSSGTGGNSPSLDRHRSNNDNHDKLGKYSTSNLILSKCSVSGTPPAAMYGSSRELNPQTQSSRALPTEVLTVVEGRKTTTGTGTPAAERPEEMRVPPTAVAASTGAPAVALSTAAAAFPASVADALDLKKDVAARDVEKPGPAGVLRQPETILGEITETGCIGSRRDRGPTHRRGEHSERCLVHQHRSFPTGSSSYVPLTWEPEAAVGDETTACTVAHSRICSISLEQLVIGCLAEESLSLPVLRLLLRAPLQPVPQQPQWIAAIPPDALRRPLAGSDGSRIRKDVPGAGDAVAEEKVSHEKNKWGSGGLLTKNKILHRDQFGDNVTAGYSNTSSNFVSCSGFIRYETLWCVLCGKSAVAVPRNPFSHPHSDKSSNSRETTNTSTTQRTNSGKTRNFCSGKNAKGCTTYTPPTRLATMCCLVRKNLNRCPPATSPNTKEEEAAVTLKENRVTSYKRQAVPPRGCKAEADRPVLELVCPHAFHLRCVNEVLLPVLRGRCVCQLFVPPPHWLRLGSDDSYVRKDKAVNGNQRGCSSRFCLTDSRCSWCGIKPESCRRGSGHHAHASFRHSGSDGGTRISRCSSSCGCLTSSINCCLSHAGADPEALSDGQGTATLMHPYCVQASQRTAHSNNRRKSSGDTTEGQTRATYSGSSNESMNTGDSQNSRSNCSGNRGGKSPTVKRSHLSAESFVPSTGEGVMPNFSQCKCAPSPTKCAAVATSASRTSGASFGDKGHFEQATSTGGTASTLPGLPSSSVEFDSPVASASSAVESVVADGSELTLACSLAVRNVDRPGQTAASRSTPLRPPAHLCREGSEFSSARSRKAALPSSLSSSGETFDSQSVTRLATSYRTEGPTVLRRETSTALTAAATHVVTPVSSRVSAPPAWSSDSGPSPLPPGLPKLLATTLKTFSRLQQLHAALLLQELHPHKGTRRASESVQRKQQSLRQSTDELPYSPGRLLGRDAVRDSIHCIHEVNMNSREYNYGARKERPLCCSSDTRSIDDPNDEDNCNNATYTSPNMYECTSCARRNYYGSLKYNSSCTTSLFVNEGNDGGSKRGDSHLIATHLWDVSPNKLQLAFPLVASATCCSSVEVYVQPLVTAWEAPLSLESGSLSWYGTAAARVMLFLLHGRENCGRDVSTCRSQDSSLGRVNIFAKDIQDGSRHSTGSVCVPRKHIKGNDNSCPASNKSSSKIKDGSSSDSDISATDIKVYKSGSRDDFNCCSWSVNRSPTGRSSRRPEGSSNSGDCTDRVTANRSFHSDAYASVASTTTSRLSEQERAAAEACPPLLRHLLLLLDRDWRYFNRENERRDSWRSWFTGAEVDSSGAQVGGAGAEPGVLRVAECVKRMHSASKRPATECGASSVTLAPSTSVPGVHAAMDVYVEGSFEATQALDSVLSATNSVTLRTCVHHPFFWDASERMDLLDCCATYLNLTASSVTSCEAGAKAVTRCRRRETAPRLRTRKKDAAPVVTAIAVAEHMAVGWRRRVDMQLRLAVGGAGLPQRSSNVESLLDFLRILRFGWKSWILKLPVEKLEILAQQYATTPLPDGVEPHRSFHFWSGEAAGASANLIHAADPNGTGLSITLNQGETAHVDTITAAGRTLVSAREEYELVESKVVDRDGATLTASAGTQGRGTAGDASLHMRPRDAAIADFTKRAAAVTSDLPSSGDNCYISAYAHKTMQEQELHQQQTRTRQQPAQLHGNGEKGDATEETGTGEIGECVCQANAEEETHHIDVHCDKICEDGAAQLKGRRRFLRRTLIESRDGALIQQLDNVHPELFLLICVIAGSSDPSSVTGSPCSHEPNIASDDSVSRGDYDVEEAYQVNQ